MIRNCMKEVANMFGLELGDKFNLRIVAYDKDYEHNPCYFSEEGLMSCEDKNGHLILLHCILTGEVEVNKLK